MGYTAISATAPGCSGWKDYEPRLKRAQAADPNARLVLNEAMTEVWTEHLLF